jgi:hypothetical protein
MKEFEKQRSKWERAMEKETTQLFLREKKDVVEAIRNSPNKKTAKKRALKEVDEQEWDTLYKAFYAGIMEDFGDRTLKSFQSMEGKQDGSADSSAFWTIEAVDFFEEVTGKRSHEVTDTTKKRIAQLIDESEEEDLDDIADQVNDLYEHDTPIRTHNIGRTEVITAASAAVTFAALSTGLTLMKEWVAVVDDRTRQSHLNVNGETIPLDETFSNGLRFPGDPDAPAEEVCNCRCQQRFYLA